MAIDDKIRDEKLEYYINREAALDRLLPKGKNKKVIGLMKDKLGKNIKSFLMI